MPVGAQDAAAIEVVEQRELAGQGVQVRRDLLSEHHQLGLSPALFDIAEDLIVGAVFLDDVDDVLEDARLAVPFGYNARLGVRARLGEARQAQAKPIVLIDPLRVLG